MKKYLLIIVALWVQLCASFAQVETKYFEGGADNASLPSYLQQVVSSSPAAIKLSKTLVTQCYKDHRDRSLIFECYNWRKSVQQWCGRFIACH